MDLFPYQDTGARWLASRRRALLGDGPRVGKTRQAIIAADMAGLHSVLVVCPGIAREHWGREFAAVSLMDRPIAVVLDKDDPIEPDGVTILSMDGSRNESLHKRVMAHRWDAIIVDEQQFMNHPETQRTKLVLSSKGFASRAGRIWFLTGTPMLNSPDELWVILATISVYRGPHAEFQDRYCKGYFGDFGFTVTGMKNVDELKAMLDKVMLRRTYYQMFPDAPRPTWQSVQLDPTVTDAADIAALADLENHPRYGRAVTKALTRVAAGEEIDWTEAIPQSNFAMLRRLTAAAKTKPSVKWIREMLASGKHDKIVVFAHHSGMVETLAADLTHLGATAIHGKVKPDLRQNHIDQFRDNPARRVIVCQDQIARTAIDLTAADALYFAEMDPVPNNNGQAAMRVQGPKQTKPVTLYCGYLPNSTDERITKINERKSKMELELFG